MKKPGTFSSVPRAGPEKPTPAKKMPNTVVPPKPKTKESAFFSELAETGTPNWKKAPKEVKTRYRGVFMILFAIPFIVVPGYEILRRISGRSTKKVQQGEILEDNTIRKFDEEEKWRTEKNSLMYKIFGKDYFLEGFTSSSMKDSGEKK